MDLEALEKLIDENVFEPLLLSSVGEDEGRILQSIFKRPDEKRLNLLEERLRPFKLGCFIGASVSFLMIFVNLGRSDLVRFCATGAITHDLFTVSRRCYVREYSVSLARINFPDMLTQVGNTLGAVTSFFGIPGRKEEYFAHLYGPTRWDILLSGTFIKRLFDYAVEKKLIETKPKRD